MDAGFAGQPGVGAEPDGRRCANEPNGDRGVWGQLLYVHRWAEMMEQSVCAGGRWRGWGCGEKPVTRLVYVRTSAVLAGMRDES